MKRKQCDDSIGTQPFSSDIANRKRLQGFRRAHPALWYFVFLFGGWSLDRIVPLPIPFPTFEWQLWSAIVLFTLSAIFAGSAIRLFLVRKTPIPPFSQPCVLLTTGPFRLSRNPLYVALVASLFAFGLLLASFWLFFCAATLALVLDRFIIRSEEDVLSKAFGATYSAYARRVRRWL